MIKQLLVAATTIVCLGGLTSTTEITRADDAGHSEHTHSDGGHQHKTVEIPAGQPVPAVNITVHPDPISGWNLETQVTNFRFAPENASKAAKPGEGHAHIYVNGKKVGRLYSAWYHLDQLPPGKNEITVSLNANSHEALVHNGQVIADTKVVQVQAKE